LALAGVGCGDEQEPPRAAGTAQPSPTATSTPPPTKKLPSLQGFKPTRTGVKIDDRDEVAAFLKEEAAKLLKRRGDRSAIDSVSCDRVVEETLVISCFLLAKDGYSDFLIAWATEAERRVIGYKAHSALTCGERAQGLEAEQALALARLIDYQTGTSRPPTRREINRDLRRDIDRRCAAGSDDTMPGQKAINALVKRIARRSR
jgi:hypothetical protein